MPIPDLDGAGLLPPGIHDCTADEVRVRFGAFQGTDRRCRLYQKLDTYIREALDTGMVAELIIDGSFVTAKPDPGDIDLILVLAGSHDFSAQLRPFEYNVLSRRQVRKLYGFDILVAPLASAVYAEYVAFFQQVRGDPGRRKGVLRVRL
jgi:hypothetical protein